MQLAPQRHCQLAKGMSSTVQGLQQVARSNSTSLTVLSPAILRDALKSAGNIVRPQEVESVLSYVVSDKQYSQLDGLYLLLLANTTVQQFQWLRSCTGQHQSGQQYFTYRDDASKAAYELLPAGTAEVAAHSETLAW